MQTRIYEISGMHISISLITTVRQRNKNIGPFIIFNTAVSYTSIWVNKVHSEEFEIDKFPLA